LQQRPVEVTFRRESVHMATSVFASQANTARVS